MAADKSICLDLSKGCAMLSSMYLQGDEKGTRGVYAQ